MTRRRSTFQPLPILPTHFLVIGVSLSVIVSAAAVKFAADLFAGLL